MGRVGAPVSTAVVLSEEQLDERAAEASAWIGEPDFVADGARIIGRLLEAFTSERETRLNLETCIGESFASPNLRAALAALPDASRADTAPTTIRGIAWKRYGERFSFHNAASAMPVNLAVATCLVLGSDVETYAPLSPSAAIADAVKRATLEQRGPLDLADVAHRLRELAGAIEDKLERAGS